MNAPSIGLVLDHGISDNVRPLRYGWRELRLHGEQGNVPVSALISLGFRSFASVNDAYGWSAGNAALKTVLTRVRSCLKKTERVEWVGGDSFMILVVDRDEAEIRRLCLRLAARLQTPIEWEGRGIRLSPVMGASTSSAAGNYERMVYEADLAQRAHCGVASAHRFSTELESKIAQEALDALHNNDFFMVYQPQVRLSDRRLIGFESLVRWDHPELGSLSPVEFLPLIERAGYMPEVGLWIVRETLSSFFHAFPAGKCDLRISVNVSPTQMDSAGFVHSFQQAIEDSGADPARIDVEITENALVIGKTETICGALGELGVSLVLDDFGAGFSSLGYLKRLPVKKLKLDRQFVEGASGNDPFLQAVVAMTRPLGVKALAEGVETESQEAMIAAVGYDEAQGFFYGKADSLGRIVDLGRRACQGKGVFFDGKRFGG